MTDTTLTSEQHHTDTEVIPVDGGQETVDGRTVRVTHSAEIAERRERVTVMLLSKVSQREMARREEVSLGTIWKDIKAIKETWRQRMAENYDAHVAEETAKLDWLERGLMAKALTGNKDAVETLLKIMDRRAKLLGLDAPARARIEVVTEDLIDAEIRRLRDQLGDAIEVEGVDV